MAPAPKSRKIESREPSPPLEQGQSVAEAVEGVGEAVSKEVEQALAEADIQEKGQATEIKKETATEEDVDSSWESAEDEHAQKQEQFKVEVRQDGHRFSTRRVVYVQLTL